MNYRRFVIVSYLRSGTHLLRTALESHPAIVCQTEVFNSDNRQLPYSLETPTKTILDNWVYTSMPDTVEMAGFVLQAYHPHKLRAFPGIRSNPLWENVWSILAGMDNLHVIQLQRRNLLRRHLSHVMARKTGNWHNWDPGRVDRITHLQPPPQEQIGAGERPGLVVELDPVQLQIDFEEVEQWQGKARALLDRHPMLSITYEELYTDFDKTCETVLQFLGFEPRILQVAVKKLETRKLSESITNYSQLKNKFTNTRWAHFFED
jgi:hypothetical protein